MFCYVKSLEKSKMYVSGIFFMPFETIFFLFLSLFYHPTLIFTPFSPLSLPSPLPLSDLRAAGRASRAADPHPPAVRVPHAKADARWVWFDLIYH